MSEAYWRKSVPRAPPGSRRRVGTFEKRDAGSIHTPDAIDLELVLSVEDDARAGLVARLGTRPYLRLGKEGPVLRCPQSRLPSERCNGSWIQRP